MDLACSSCQNQANCAASTANTCATVQILDPVKCAVKGSGTTHNILKSHPDSGGKVNRIGLLQTCTTMDANFGKTICTSVTADGFWLDGEVVKANNVDTDGDGIPDLLEKACNPKNKYCTGYGSGGTYTSGGSGARTAAQLATVDSDGDNIPDYLDLDSDNDGIPDAIEKGCTGSLCDKQHACELTAYWDINADGPCGNDHNKDWCTDSGKNTVNCPTDKGKEGLFF